MKLLRYLLLNSCFFIWACDTPKTKSGISDTSTHVIDKVNIKDVSLISLIANPERYNGKKIRVIGYLHLEFEGNNLFLHKEDYECIISKNALWVDINTKYPKGKTLKKYNNHYVILEGLFNSKNNGHEAMNSGSLKNITRSELWDSITIRSVNKFSLPNYKKIEAPLIIPPPIIQIEDALNNVDKLVGIDGILAYVSTGNPKSIILTLVGNSPPYASMKIFVKGNKIKLNSFKLNAHMIFRGKISLVNNSPVMIVTNCSQIGLSSD